MCYSADARPAIPPMRGAAIDCQDLILRSSDGAKIAAFFARADSPTGAGIVILPHVRGLTPFFEELSLRFAEVGIDAIAIDYYGRTAGAEKRSMTFEFRDHNTQVRWRDLNADVAAAVGHLRSSAGGACASVFTVGFCFGGGLSWLQAANRQGLQGAIGVHGVLQPVRDEPGAIERAPEFSCPVLALQGEADEAISVDQVERFRDALQRAGIEHEVVVYPGAPHGFFDGAHERLAPNADKAAIKKACEDAWPRMLAFIRIHHEEHVAAPA